MERGGGLVGGRRKGKERGRGGGGGLLGEGRGRGGVMGKEAKERRFSPAVSTETALQVC